MEQLLGECTNLASDGTADSITGYAVMDSELQQWRELFVSVNQEVEELRNNIGRSRASQVESFEARLLDELNRQGHSIYGQTALFIVDGVVHVETQVEKGMVLVNGLRCHDLSVTAIASQVRSELDRMSKLLTPPDQMIRYMLEAYRRELQIGGQEEGSQVRTTAILVQIAFLRQKSAFGNNPNNTNYRGYPRELFRADLYRLLESRETVVDGMRLRHAAGSDTTGAIFMLEPGVGRPVHIGRIWFEPEKE